MSTIERQRDEAARALRTLIQCSILAALLGGGYLIGQATPTPVLVFMLVMIIGTALTAVVTVRGRTRKQNERTQRAEVDTRSHKMREEQAYARMFHMTWIEPSEEICARIDEACGVSEEPSTLQQYSAMTPLAILDDYDRLHRENLYLQEVVKSLESQNKNLRNRFAIPNKSNQRREYL